MQVIQCGNRYREDLLQIVNEFEEVCDTMGLKIIVGKSKVSGSKRPEGSCKKMKVSREEMQEVKKFNYLGVMISRVSGEE